MILATTNLLLSTRYGDLDCIGETPSGRFKYEEVAAHADHFDVGDGVTITEIENLAALREVRDGKRR